MQNPSTKPCQTPRCKNKARKRRRYCNTCQQRKYRAANPLMSAFHNLKGHAKARGKQFLFTIQTFERFCLETGYLSKRLAGIDVTIDRVKEHGPYSYENCQMLYNADNVKKYHNEQRTIENAVELIGSELFYSGNPL